MAALPRDFSRRAAASRSLGRVPLEIAAGRADALAELCRTEHCTWEAGVVAMIAALFIRYLDSADVEIVLACGGAALLVRLAAAGDTTIRALVRHAHGAVLAAGPVDGSSPIPMRLDIGDTPPPATPTADLSIQVEDGRLDGWLVFDASLFRRATAERVASHLAGVVAGATGDPDRTVESLEVEPLDRRLADVLEWNCTDRVFDHASRLVHESIAERAHSMPDAIAVVGAGHSLSYAELERRSRALARRLRTHGAGPEVPIGVCARRSPEAVVTCLAILRAGATYLPLDPGYPAARLDLMIADAGVRTLLVEPGAPLAFPPHVAVIALTPEVFDGDAPLDVAVSPDHLAYIMYTSGSTGVPKGVMITHAAIRNTLAWMQDAYPLQPGDLVAHKTSISFTDSIWEILWPPMVGARLAVIEDRNARFPRLLLQELHRLRVAVTQFVPAQMRQFLDEIDRTGDPDPLPDLRWVFNGGEALPPALARDWFRRFPRTLMANAYGMTESAIYGTNFVVEPADGEPVVLVGYPIANERAYVLDRDGQPCAPLCTGEIYLAGDSLARGYLGRPDLTAERFVPDPWGPSGARMYRTGDLGRRSSTGEIACLGRCDRQVKVHGGRVELGEVEATLARHPAVRQAVVTARRDGADHVLSAYYTCRAADPGPRELFRFLSAELPSYMVPARLIAVEAFPLTVNGKIDRERLDRERLERDAPAHN
ncbi:MAG TPA: amino acid adenylation domain-containing protein [Kofleriaceae bacterium]